MVTIPSHQPWLPKVSVEKRMGASEADDLAVLSGKSGGYYVEMVRTEGHRFLNIFSLADGG